MISGYSAELEYLFECRQQYTPARKQRLMYSASSSSAGDEAISFFLSGEMWPCLDREKDTRKVFLLEVCVYEQLLEDVMPK